jgi:hypothetical protein
MRQLQQNATEQPKKNVLMVAYLFPPAGGIGAAGSQRVLKFAKYLPLHLWRPVVLTVHERDYESYLSLDPTLLEKVPPNTTIVRTTVIRWMTKLLEWQKRLKSNVSRKKAEAKDSDVMHSRANGVGEQGRLQSLKDAITDLFEIPDEEIGWFLPSVYAGLRVVKQEAIDAIYATGRPWTALVVGLALRQLSRKPLIVDFRDPWMTNPFRVQYSALKNRLETVLERLVVERADVVIANTVELREEFLQRFPQQPSSKFIFLVNGFDPDDYLLDGSEGTSVNNDVFTLAHTGFLYGKRDPKTFLEAVKRLVDQRFVDPQRFKIVFVGSIELPYNLSAYLAAANLEKIVTLHDHVPYRESLRFLRDANALLLLQPGTTTQIPSKLFEYIGAKKPIVAVSPRQGATSQIIMREELGAVADPDDIEEIGRSLVQLYRAWTMGTLESSLNSAAYAKFDINSITQCLASTLLQVTAA